MTQPPINLSPQTLDEYRQTYAYSLAHSREFWSRLARAELEFSGQWDDSARLNITINCLDRHISAGTGDRLAYLHTDEAGQESRVTYQQLLDQVNRLANGLLSLGVGVGDRVAIYQPISIAQVVSMLACARIGALHTVIFSGFNSMALLDRLQLSGAKVVLTRDITVRRGHSIAILDQVRQAQKDLKHEIKVVVECVAPETKLKSTELNWTELLDHSSPEYTPELFPSSQPLFILYTSGTTGQPKGIVHATGGYNLYTHVTTKAVFQPDSGDLYWCSADSGWITGHSYVVYGPLSNGVSVFLYEGAPDYPAPDRWWHLIEQYQITHLYTSPTAIRMFMKQGQEYPHSHDLSSLQLIGSVGEPLNPAAWHWYKQHIGNNRAQIIDTWWQTETGGHMLVTLPNLPQKPGVAGLPFFGVKPVIVDSVTKQELAPGRVGQLVITNHWPGELQTCWQDEERYNQYWSDQGFITGDMASSDTDGYIQILGRSDDVIKVSGHRIGSAELENLLVGHQSVVEVAVIGVDDDITGQAIHAFIVASGEVANQSEFLATLGNFVATTYGKFATPKQFHLVDSLPKTRSGKIVRRLLRSQILKQDPGDLSTLED